MYDYVEGKLDWIAAGMRFEGTLAGRATAGSVALRDVPTCRTDERLGDVANRVRSAGSDAGVVVNVERVVFGLMRSKELAGDPDQPVERAMRPGPSTFRPNVPILEMAEYMAEHELPNCPVTTSDGRLVGLLVREDAIEAARAEHERLHHVDEEEG